MRITILLSLIVGALALPFAATSATAERIGVGLEYDLAAGDVDDAVGLLVGYFREIDDLLGYQIDVGHVAGDYALEGLQGDYTRTGIEVAMVFRFPQDALTTYLGAGTGYHFNDFDGLDVQDKLSLVFLGGVFVNLSEDLDLDISLRYRFLQPDCLAPGIEKVDMDALVVRAGVSWSW